MFPGGSGRNPANKWVKRVQKYYWKTLRKHVQTHDIRKTAITEFYNRNKDIVSTQRYVGHSSIKITQLYVDKPRKEIDEQVKELFAHRKAAQTNYPQNIRSKRRQAPG